MSLRASSSSVTDNFSVILSDEYLEKHVINDPAEDVGIQSLRGLAYLNPRVELDEENRGKSKYFFQTTWGLTLAGSGASARTYPTSSVSLRRRVWP
jgi:hypothetical protein